MSIWWGDVFVQGGQRRAESIRGLGILGVGGDRQHYLGLSDAGLSLHMPAFVASLRAVANHIQPRAIVTFDATGFDGHTDHQVAHSAGLVVAECLGAELFTRVAEPFDGDVAVYADPGLKRLAIDEHFSQYGGTIDRLAGYCDPQEPEYYRIARD